MEFNKYIVTLTNGTMKNKYTITAFNRDQAVILAQADAIKKARGYQLLSVYKV